MTVNPSKPELYANQLWQDRPLPDAALHDKTILISGAAGSLGSNLAKQCAALGATVILLDKNQTALETLSDEIMDRDDPQPVICGLDFLVTEEAVYDELQQQLSEQFGQLHGLVHCAAAFDLPSPVLDIDVSTWQQQLQVNLTVPYLLTRHLLPLLQDSKDSRIIFTSDSAARNSTAYWGAYGVAKCAIEAFAHTLADELDSANQVKVNIVIPGAMHSRIRQCAFPAEAPQERIAIDQVTPVYLHLLAESGNQFHGQVIHAQSQQQEH